MNGERAIELRGLRCPGRHGAYEGERDVVRTFLVDVAARGADERDAETIAACVRDAVAGTSHALLERVASDVADALFGCIDRITEVRVRVAKPDPPGLDAASEAVSLSRARRAAPAPSA